MKIEALRSFGLKGVVVQVGEVVEASPLDARQLLNSGQAKEAVICEVQIEEPAPKPKKTPRKPKKPTPTSDE
tara:strand:+ start:4410 stop:4625 length:216 start_codon:yes stop_codon:yes gene_type:complete